MRRRTSKIAAVAASSMLALAIVELGFRATRRPPKVPENILCAPCAEVFELNPARPGISSQHLRDREYSAEPAPDTLRMMVLGDSLAYGLYVPAEDSFPKVLERDLGPHVEVVNTGVSGYTPFNERQYYVTRGHLLHPRLVVISFCMNDVVDPLSHWAHLVAGRFDMSLAPAESIPNPTYHTEHVIPLLREEQRIKGLSWRRALRQSEIYKRAFDPLLFPVHEPDTHVAASGKTYPAHVTGEDTQSIEVLMNYDSPEWTWLRSQYDAMIAAIRADGADVAIVVHPLMYQLEPDYPLFPQRLWDRYCHERSIPCLDLLPALRAQGGAALFVGRAQSVVDVWHYTAAGHRVVGHAVAAWLDREGLVKRTP